jgi:hypothetical protein
MAPLELSWQQYAQAHPDGPGNHQLLDWVHHRFPGTVFTSPARAPVWAALIRLRWTDGHGGLRVQAPPADVKTVRKRSGKPVRKRRAARRPETGHFQSLVFFGGDLVVLAGSAVAVLAQHPGLDGDLAGPVLGVGTNIPVGPYTTWSMLALLVPSRRMSSMTR